MVLPALKHAKRVQFAGAAEGDDQQKPTDETADDGGGDDSGRNNDGTTLLITAIATIVLSIAHPRLKDAAVILQGWGSEVKYLSSAYIDIQTVTCRVGSQNSKCLLNHFI